MWPESFLWFDFLALYRLYANEDGAQEDNGVEIDDLFVENLQLSVGTVIKRGASKVFAKLQKEAITKSERKVMR